MTRIFLRLLVASAIASAVTTACLYGVPDVVPTDPDASDARSVDVEPRDNFVPPRDAGPDVDAGCTVCPTTILEGSGTVTAFIIEESGKRAFMATRQGTTGALVEFDPTAAGIQTQPIATTAAPITAIAGSTNNSIVYQMGTEIFRVTPPGAPQAITFTADGGTFALQALIPGIDATSGAVFVLGSLDGAPTEVRRIIVATGVNDSFATPAPGAVGHRFIDGADAVYWFEPSTPLSALTRVQLSNKAVTKSSAQYFPALGLRASTPYVATSTAFTRLTATAVANGTIVGPNDGVPVLLAAADDPGRPGSPYWVQQGDPIGVARFATSTTTSAVLAPIKSAGFAIPISFLVGINDRMIIVANGNDRYVVARF